MSSNNEQKETADNDEDKKNNENNNNDNNDDDDDDEEEDEDESMERSKLEECAQRTIDRFEEIFQHVNANRTRRGPPNRGPIHLVINNLRAVTRWHIFDQIVDLNPIDDTDQQFKRERTDLYLETVMGSYQRTKKLSRMCAFTFDDLSLNDLETFFSAILESGAIIRELNIQKCHLTEQAARTLSKILTYKFTDTDTNTATDGADSSEGTNTNNGGFCIKKLNLEKLTGSTAWIDGLLQNKTITDLSLQHMPIQYTALQFIQTNATQLKQVKIWDLTSEQEREEITSEKEDNSDKIDDAGISKLKTLDIRFHEKDQFPINLCQMIGSILRQSNKLKVLKLRNIKGNLPHDFLKDAIHRKVLVVHDVDFDPPTLASMIKKKSNEENGERAIKHLCLKCPKYMSKIQDFFHLVDISTLDSFQIDFDNEMVADMTCRQLVANKGPRNLKIRFDDEMDLNQVASNLASGLSHNDKIQGLLILANKIGDEDLEPQRKLVRVIMREMPRLETCIIYTRGRRAGEETMKQWQEWITHHVQSNWTLKELESPFPMDNMEEIEKTMMINNQWHKLFSRQDRLPSGIWSPALSRMETANMMFRVLKEVPNLFQQVADTASERQVYCEPRFTVSHHSNCPGCHKRRKQQQEQTNNAKDN